MAAARTLVVLGYPDIASAADATPHILPHHPEQLEGIDDRLITFERERQMNPEALHLLPAGHAVDALSPHLRRGTKIVGLEPSCTAVFRSDARELMPGNRDVERLCKQTVTLSELLQHHTDGWQPPHIGGQAITQTHCHQHAIMGYDEDKALLRAAGIDLDVLDAGCCGLAGNFGFEAGHYDVSIACGERVLLPAVRAAAEDALVLADGFSCRTQIEQGGTGRTPVHLAEVLAAALHGEQVRPVRPTPPTAADYTKLARRLAGLTAGAIAVAVTALRRRRRVIAGPIPRRAAGGADAVGVVVGNGRDDQFVGFGGIAQTLQLVHDLARVADELAVDAVGDQLAVSLAPDMAASLLGSGKLDGTFGGADAGHPQAVGGGQLAGRGLGAGHDDVG